MAEINVERKRGGGRGPLLLVLLVLIAAAAVWWFMSRGKPQQPPPSLPIDSAAPVAADTPAAPITAPPVPVDPAAVPEPGIVGDDTSGRTGDTLPLPQGDERLGNP